MSDEQLGQVRKEQLEAQMQSLRESEAAILQAQLDELIELAILQEQEEALLRARAAAEFRRINLSDEERVALSSSYLQRLGVERVLHRRKLGKRVTFLTNLS